MAEIEMRTITCSEAGCGITFTVPERWVEARREDHRTWYCPNGHKRHYPAENVVERLQSELAAEQGIAERLRAIIKHKDGLRDAMERSRAALYGRQTRARNRLAKGLCPYCNERPTDLAKHIREAHTEKKGD